MVRKVIKNLALVACFFTLLILWQHQKEKVGLIKYTRKYNANVKHILFWTPFFTIEDYFIGFGSEPFKKCDYKNCFITNNRSLLSVDKFDAILFHGSIYDRNKNEEPAVRSPSQVYIYVNGEPPILTTPNLNHFHSFYNWTMTYRFDSNVQFPYETFVKMDTNYVLPSTDFVKNKSKIMAWFVSNCRTSSKREVLMKHVMNYIPVDVYGRCGNLQCLRLESELSIEECHDMVEKNYKFYFSGENSFCKDYVTEKLYNVLKRNVVPVVYGGADYTKSAPPNSVIHVENFENAYQLGKYLKFLDDNPTEYLRYFEWKKHYKVIDNQAACQLCQKLNEPIVKSVIENLHEWFWGPNNELCRENKNLPTIVSNSL